MTLSRARVATRRLTFATAIFAGISLTTLTGGVAMAQETPDSTSASQEATDQGVGTLTQLSSAEFVLRTASGVSSDVTDSGATLTQGGVVESLPTSATDSTGAAVQLRYVQSGDGLHIQVIDPTKTASDSGSVAARGVFQCILGTGGGAGGGGLAGAGVGSAIPGLGTAAGAIIGGVSGAASGAAASCF